MAKQKKCIAGIVGYHCKVEAEIKDNYLTVRIPVNKKRPTNSGSYVLIATTKGNVETGLTIDGKPVSIGVNAYIAK